MPVRNRQVITELEADGWQQTNQVGSHRQFEHPTKPGKVTVSGSLNEEPKPGTLSSIRRQSGLPKLGRGKTS